MNENYRGCSHVYIYNIDIDMRYIPTPRSRTIKFNFCETVAVGIADVVVGTGVVITVECGMSEKAMKNSIWFTDDWAADGFDYFVSVANK